MTTDIVASIPICTNIRSQKLKQRLVGKTKIITEKSAHRVGAPIGDVTLEAQMKQQHRQGFVADTGLQSQQNRRRGNYGEFRLVNRRRALFVLELEIFAGFLCGFFKKLVLFSNTIAINDINSTIERKFTCFEEPVVRVLERSDDPKSLVVRFELLDLAALLLLFRHSLQYPVQDLDDTCDDNLLVK